MLANTASTRGCKYLGLKLFIHFVVFACAKVRNGFYILSYYLEKMIFLVLGIYTFRFLQ